MTQLLTALDRALTRLVRLELSWWVWPAGLVLLALGSLGAAALLHPAGDEFFYFPDGTRFGDTCAMIVLIGQPCPQCGMTRSWVHAVRLDLWTAFLYNPAGLALLGWILVAGVIGAARLITRDPSALRPPWQLHVGWAMFWLIGLYAIPWGLRLAGVNPLP